MIPNGTRCIVISSCSPLTIWVGKTCVVTGQGIRPEHFADFKRRYVVMGDELEIEFEDGTSSEYKARYTPERTLMPIGHDPDAETRETTHEATS